MLYKKHLTYITFLIYGLSCNVTTKDEIQNRSIDFNNQITKNNILSKNQSLDKLYSELEQRSIGNSCIGTTVGENIEFISETLVYTSDSSYGDFNTIKPGKGFYIYFISVNECEESDRLKGLKTRVKSYWSIIQDAQSGEIFDLFTSFPQVVDNYLYGQLSMILGKPNSNNEVKKGSNSENEKLRKELLNLIN